MIHGAGSGLWDQNANDYDAETLTAVNLDRAQLARPADMDQPECELLPEYRRMWPAFDTAPWFPALGDGACDNLGSGCIAADRFALMVGTTGAMRAVIASPRVEIPAGLVLLPRGPEAIRDGRRAFEWRRCVRVDEANADAP